MRVYSSTEFADHEREIELKREKDVICDAHKFTSIPSISVIRLYLDEFSSSSKRFSNKTLFFACKNNMFRCKFNQFILKCFKQSRRRKYRFSHRISAAELNFCEIQLHLMLTNKSKFLLVLKFFTQNYQKRPKQQTAKIIRNKCVFEIPIKNESKIPFCK